MVKRTRGAIIAVEGLSFAGKSTGIRILREELGRLGIPHVVVEWNSVRAVRKAMIWLYARGWMTPVVYSLIQWKLCLAVYLFRMRPALANGTLVIADRYIHTGLTRDSVNGAASGLLARLLYRVVPKPEGILFFSLEPDLCLASMKQSPGRSLFHLCKRIKAMDTEVEADLTYLQALEDSYRRLMEEGRWIQKHAGVVILDGRGARGSDSIAEWIPSKLLMRVDQHVGQYRADIISRTTGAIQPESEGEPAMPFDRVVSILKEFAQHIPETVQAHHKLNDDLGIDSVNIVKIILAIEEEFDVEIDMSAIRMDAFRTVDGVVRLVSDIVAAEPAEV